jgi:hypothetical protein
MKPRALYMFPKVGVHLRENGRIDHLVKNHSCCSDSGNKRHYLRSLLSKTKTNEHNSIIRTATDFTRISVPAVEVATRKLKLLPRVYKGDFE